MVSKKQGFAGKNFPINLEQTLHYVENDIGTLEPGVEEMVHNTFPEVVSAFVGLPGRQ